MLALPAKPSSHSCKLFRYRSRGSTSASVNSASKRLEAIPGFGVIASTAVVATVTDPEASGGAKLINGTLQALKDLCSDPEERLPGIGQDQGAGSSLEQCQPEVIFERLDLPAHGGLGKEQFLGSLGEAQIARCRFESLKERGAAAADSECARRSAVSWAR